MSITNNRLCSGTLADSNATLYTAAATSGLYVIIKSLTLCNKTASAATVTLKLDGVEIYSALSIAANTTVIVTGLDQIIEAEELIEGSASAASAINYYISGKVITT